MKPGQGNIWQYIRRKVSPAQEDFVASNDLSLIGAFAVREDGYTALPFGLAENGEPVGFLMIGCGSIGDADEPARVRDSCCIRRLMIDRRFQGRGLGKAVLAALAYIRPLWEDGALPALLCAGECRRPGPLQALRFPGDRRDGRG